MGWINLTRWRSDTRSRAAWLLALLVVCWLHEGFPPLPPVAAKQKLFYLIIALALLARLAPRLEGRRFALASGGLLSAAFVWLGFNKFLAGAATSSTFIPVVALALWLIAGASFLRLDVSKHAGFAAPVAVLVTAAAGAGLALAGAFIGLAQLLGATAALIGGYLAPRYLLVILGHTPAATAMTPDMLWFLLAVVVVMLMLTSLLAPNVSLLAMALLALTPGATAVAPSFHSVAEPIRPLLSGVIAAIPAAAAILLMLWQTGAFAAN
jgi:hypothetical protein